MRKRSRYIAVAQHRVAHRRRRASALAGSRTIPRTSWPAWTSRAETDPPIYPLAPVTKIFIRTSTVPTRAMMGGRRFLFL